MKYCKLKLALFGDQKVFKYIFFPVSLKLCPAPREVDDPSVGRDADLAPLSDVNRGHAVRLDVIFLVLGISPSSTIDVAS